MKVDLLEWMREHPPDEALVYRRAWGDQCCWVRDDLAHLMSCEHRASTSVIATHTSKSVKLPVYELVRQDLGLRIILRCNFHDWKMSVLSDAPVIADFAGLFHTTPPLDPSYTGDPLSACYFEGFPKELIFGYYETSDLRTWSAHMWAREQVWAAIYLIMKARGAMPALEWMTHAKAEAKRAAEKEARDGMA